MLRVSPRGPKTWTARLKRPDGYYFERKIGTCPSVELAEARATFYEWKYHGIPEPKMDVNALCDRYLEEYAKPNKSAWPEDERILRVAVRPAIGGKAVNEVSKSDIREILNNAKFTLSKLYSHFRPIDVIKQPINER